MFNGNISETFWRTDSDNIKRKYGYQYDNLNRLLEANYGKEDPNTLDNYLEKLSYDKAGNILTLERNGNLDPSGGIPVNQIDKLEYSYHPQNKNQLLKVNDLSNSPQGFDQSNDIATGDVDANNEDHTDDYTYDFNGNMKTDTNKGIENITYNHLNLPTNIVFSGTTNGTISYLYNAIGGKVKKVVDATSLNTTDYLNGFQYTNTTLDFFPHAEGYVKYTPPAGRGSGIYSYVFNYTDHLGNIRVSYGKDPSTNVLKVLEENHYYPFGLKHTNYNSDKLMYVKEAEVYKLAPINTILPTYKYKYNGQELQEELGLNVTAMDFRQYDNALGRFLNPDRLSELAYSITPYRFAYNNPNFYKDPLGLYEIDSNGNIRITDLDEIKKFQSFISKNSKATVEEASNHVLDPSNEYARELEAVTVVITKKGVFKTNISEQLNKRMDEFQKRLDNFNGTVYYDNKHFTDTGIPNSVHAGAIGLSATMADGVLQAKTFEAIKSNNLSVNFSKTLKTTGKVFQAVGIAATLYTYAQSDRSGADKARLVGATIITSTAFIPVAGPFISFGLGILDGVGAFDSLYNKFD